MRQRFASLRGSQLRDKYEKVIPLSAADIQHYLPLLAPLLVAVPVSLIFLFVFIAGLIGMKKANASLHWPVVQGRIVESFVHERQKSDRIKYTPKIEYEYTFQGQGHRGSTINFGGRRALQTREEADDYIRPYAKGRDVPVYVNPASPGEACLLPGEGAGGIAAVIGGCGFLFVVGIVLIHFQSL